MSFQERFKTKFTMIDKHGEICIKPGQGIMKPFASQIHSPVMRNIGKSIVEPNTRPPTVFHSHGLSVPPRLIESQAPQSISDPLTSIPKRSILNFVPYSLNDYKLIKPKKYYMLGGAGPGYVGTDDWVNKKKILDKRSQYGNDANLNNVRKVIRSSQFDILWNSENLKTNF
jgi:hypothetical protein